MVSLGEKVVAGGDGGLLTQKEVSLARRWSPGAMSADAEGG